MTLPATDQAAAPAPEPAPYQRTPKGETVLVVEDEEALREVTKRIFTRNGYRVLTAAGGPQALDIARSHDGEIHLLVTDVVMPQMLGKEVADKVQAIKPGIEVLYMSGYARPVLASQGRLDPGVALVEKPFSEAELLAAAGQVLNGHFQGFKTTQARPHLTIARTEPPASEPGSGQNPACKRICKPGTAGQGETGKTRPPAPMGATGEPTRHTWATCEADTGSATGTYVHSHSIHQDKRCARHGI